MKVYFAASEYNPFHNGHAYHIDAARRNGATHFVAVMSPNFVQRGEPAFFDKFLRACAAVLGGADIVLELPLAFALSSAERFASGVVETALSTGICGGFTFGCETDMPELLFEIARIMNRPGFYEKVNDARAEGASFPTACARVCGDKYEDVFSGSNNLLGIEYIRALMKRGFSGDILPVRRLSVCHDSASVWDGFASAMSLRALLRGGGDISPFVPTGCAELYAEAMLRGEYPENYERAVVSLLRAAPESAYYSIPDAGGGFAQRLFRSVRENDSLAAVFDGAKTKRFTHSAVRRAVYNVILSITLSDIEQNVRYIRPLAFRSDTAAELFEKMSLAASVPILSRHAQTKGFDEMQTEAYNMEYRATDIYNSFLKNPRKCGTDRTDRVFVLN